MNYRLWFFLVCLLHCVLVTICADFDLLKKGDLPYNPIGRYTGKAIADFKKEIADLYNKPCVKDEYLENIWQNIENEHDPEGTYTDQKCTDLLSAVKDKECYDARIYPVTSWRASFENPFRIQLILALDGIKLIEINRISFANDRLSFSADYARNCSRKVGAIALLCSASYNFWCKESIAKSILFSGAISFATYSFLANFASSKEREIQNEVWLKGYWTRVFESVKPQDVFTAQDYAKIKSRLTNGSLGLYQNPVVYKVDFTNLQDEYIKGLELEKGDIKLYNTFFRCCDYISESEINSKIYYSNSDDIRDEVRFKYTGKYTSIYNHDNESKLLESIENYKNSWRNRLFLGPENIKNLEKFVKNRRDFAQQCGLTPISNIKSAKK